MAEGSLSQADVSRQRKKAETYIENENILGNSTTVRYIYRDKYRGYWRDVKDSGYTLPTYPKHRNGHRRNPLNALSTVRGVFFSVNMDWRPERHGRTKEPSLFGDRRLEMHISDFLNKEHNMYFNDFYCMTEVKDRDGDNHCVTLVVCRAGSPEDNICSELLPRLNRRNNMFLWRDSGSFQLTKCSGLWVEIFYASNDPVNVSNRFKKMKEVECEYPEDDPLALTGRYQIEGCHTCNIKHV